MFFYSYLKIRSEDSVRILKSILVVGILIFLLSQTYALDQDSGIEKFLLIGRDGMAKFEQGRFEEAFTLLESATNNLTDIPIEQRLDNRQEIAKFYSALAQIYLINVDLGDVQKAINAFREALSYDSELNLDEDRVAPKVIKAFKIAKDSPIPEKQSGAQSQETLEIDFARIKSVHDDQKMSEEAKKAAYQKFMNKWPRNTKYRPLVERWMKFDDSLEEFVLINMGTFRMGSLRSEKKSDGDKGQHQVTITRSFFLAKYEVTQELWIRVMGNNPSHFSSCGDTCPVEMVSWYDAVEFCNRLSALEGLTRCYMGVGKKIAWDRECTGYRLPTESEWEYAARAGTITDFACGEDDCLDSMGWYMGNSGRKTHPVGGKEPNAWGLYDMYGNISEWVWDWHGMYPSVSIKDPVGPLNGSEKINRGGDWRFGAKNCHSASRGHSTPLNRSGRLGFRLARTAK